MGAKWQGAKYLRKTNKTWRDSNTGNVYDKNGKFLGPEIARKHFYGADPKKLKKGSVRPKPFKPKK